MPMKWTQRKSVALVTVSAFAALVFAMLGGRYEAEHVAATRMADVAPDSLPRNVVLTPSVAPPDPWSVPLSDTAGQAEVADLFQAWLLAGTPEQRASLLKLAIEDPVELARTARSVVSRLPAELVAVRVQAFALMVDAAELVLESRTLTTAESDAFFVESKTMALAEMKVAEFVRPEGLDALTDTQRDSLLHQGVLLERQGELVRPTIEAKVVALHLVGRFPSPIDQAAVVSELSTSTMSSFTRETLQSVAKRYALTKN
jgi:hypothetical protein